MRLPYLLFPSILQDMASSSPDTGDILLFRGNQLVSKLLECFGRSKYSHVAMIIKNPRFLRPDVPDGFYVLEASSNDAPDAEASASSPSSLPTPLLGVALHRLEDVLALYPADSVYIRHVSCTRDEAFYERLSAAHEEVHHKPYDLNPLDWIRAEWNLIHPLEISTAYQKTSSFWCSALLCYLYSRLGLLEEEMDWSLIAPREFSAEEGTLLRFRCAVSKEVPFTTALLPPLPLPPLPPPLPPLPLLPASTPPPQQPTDSDPLTKTGPSSEDHLQ